MSTPTPDEQGRFLVHLQRLLSEGSFVATYKFALLLAIADECVERGDESGAAMTLTTTQLAARMLRYYWPQARPYAPVGGRAPRVLQQSTGPRSAILDALAAERSRHDRSLTALQSDAGAWRPLLRAATRVVEVQPLWKLQTVGGAVLPFLYPNAGRGHSITLEPGVAFCLRKFHELVSDLVRGAWVRHVRQLPVNHEVLSQTTDLDEFLFDPQRGELKRYGAVLAEVQKGQCFYCQKQLCGDGAVDHFVPWSRYPLDLGHNFVVAHAKCNGYKSDRLAALPHLARWCDVLVVHGASLGRAFDAGGMAHDLATSRRIAQWVYAKAEASGAQLWLDGRRGLEPAGPGWRALPGMAA